MNTGPRLRDRYQFDPQTERELREALRDGTGVELALRSIRGCAAWFIFLRENHSGPLPPAADAAISKSLRKLKGEPSKRLRTQAAKIWKALHPDDGSMPEDYLEVLKRASARHARGRRTDAQLHALARGIGWALKRNGYQLRITSSRKGAGEGLLSTVLRTVLFAVNYKPVADKDRDYDTSHLIRAAIASIAEDRTDPAERASTDDLTAYF